MSVRPFSVWAPLADAVYLEVGDERIPMKRSRVERGWWVVETDGNSQAPGGPSLCSGTDYAFVLVDGEHRTKALPDPRSPYQPHGVHGPSRTFDHDAFVWTDQGFRAPPLASGVLYELHVGTFTPEGTFLSAIDALDHLVELGVTHVELLPVNTFPGERGWGYDGVDLWAPFLPYCRGPSGEDLGPTALKQLVDACHARGLAVLNDVVYNHLGPTGNYLGQFGPYFTERYHTPWGDAVNLDDAYCDEVRRFFIENALMWMRDYHFDGLRVDAVHALRDFGAVHFLRELSEKTRALEKHLGRPLVLIAESDIGDPRMVQSPEIGGHGMDAQWADEVHHALHAVLTGERSGYYADFGDLRLLAKALKNPFVFDGQYSEHRKRRHGAPPTGLGGERFCVFAQNHDQIGNRAAGERLSALVSPAASKIALALIFCSPYVPMLFMGEEWGATSPFLYFTGHEDEALAEAVRTGRRNEFRAFGWRPEDVPDPQAKETFERSKLDWAERSRAPHADLLSFTRRLIRLRRSEPELSDGRRDRVTTRFDDSARWLSLRRGNIEVLVAFGPSPANIPLEGAARAETLLTSTEEALALSESPDEAVRLPAESVAILRLSHSPD